MIGAGLSGLAGAGVLVRHGCEVTVFEKSRGVGGRLATRRVDDVAVNHGAPAIDAAPGSALADTVARLTPDAREVNHSRCDAADGAPMHNPTTFPAGVTRWAKAMADGLDIRRGVRAAYLRSAAGAYELGDEQGNGLGAFDALLVSAPAPQAADLLQTCTQHAARAEMLRGVIYHPAVMVLAGICGAGGERLLVPERPSPFAHIAVGTGIDWCPVAARLDAETSAGCLDGTPDSEVLERHLVALVRQVAGAGEPVWSQVKRWRFCLPESRLLQDEANADHAGVVLCGDAVSPAGMSHVFDSGVTAAMTILGDG